ncbi:MAG: hypothetical protein AAGA96_03525 [Verrucomicrobiota bacterium]
MSGEEHDPNSDTELESLLGNLRPSPLDHGQIARLEHDQARVAVQTRHAPSSIQWRKVIPLTITSCALIAVFAFYQFGAPLLNQPDSDDGMAKNSPVEVRGVVPATPGTLPERLVPVSAHGYMVNTSSEGVIQTEEGPRQKMNVRFEDAYHWHDPETGTNIRYFQPRNEEIIVPLQTD